jgi:hypothetical protein
MRRLSGEIVRVREIEYLKADCNVSATHTGAGSSGETRCGEVIPSTALRTGSSFVRMTIQGGVSQPM